MQQTMIPMVSTYRIFMQCLSVFSGVVELSKNHVRRTPVVTAVFCCIGLLCHLNTATSYIWDSDEEIRSSTQNWPCSLLFDSAVEEHPLTNLLPFANFDKGFKCLITGL